jgi:hypothetical protein
MNYISLLVVSASALGAFATLPAIAQEDLRKNLKCAKRIDVEKPIWDSSGEKVRVTALSVCVAPNHKTAGVHFIVSSGRKDESYPRVENAPWLYMEFKDGFGKNIWEGDVALASVGTCGGYQTHYMPAPVIDWNSVKVATASMGGSKGDKCGGPKGLEKVAAEVLNSCKKELGAKDEGDCIKKVYNIARGGDSRAAKGK